MTDEPEFIVSTVDVMYLTTADRYAVCERDTRQVIVGRRSNGQHFHMTYKSERGANTGLARASGVLRDTALMVVDRHAE